MTQREKLIELLLGADKKTDEHIRKNDHMDYVPTLEELYGVFADHLLANGVIVDVHCPCGLREDMEEGDCEKTDCDRCCPLAERSEGNENHT